MRVTAVLPALNEEKTVGGVVRGCLDFVDQVLVVDGGSEDGTPHVALTSGARVLRLGRRGKGLAIQAAIRQEDADILLFVDADGSHRPQDIPHLVEPILRDEADLVIASRVTGGSDELYGRLDHLPRAVGMRLVQTLVNLCLGVGLTDIQNGFRAIKTPVARNLRLQEAGFGIDQEMAIRCLRMGYRVCNVPSHEDRRRFGKSNLCFWRVAPGVLWSAVRLLAGAVPREPRPTERGRP